MPADESETMTSNPPARHARPAPATRTEHDLLGDREVPADAGRLRPLARRATGARRPRRALCARRTTAVPNTSLEVYRRLAATAAEARCLHHLTLLGQAPASPVGRAGYGDRLSPREQQVRDLLAGGATNRDIAAALFLSPRTVEHHAAAVLRKLGTTRARLAAGHGP